MMIRIAWFLWWNQGQLPEYFGWHFWWCLDFLQWYFHQSDHHVLYFCGAAFIYMLYLVEKDLTLSREFLASRQWLVGSMTLKDFYHVDFDLIANKWAARKSIQWKHDNMMCHQHIILWWGIAGTGFNDPWTNYR